MQRHYIYMSLSRHRYNHGMNLWILCASKANLNPIINVIVNTVTIKCIYNLIVSLALTYGFLKVIVNSVNAQLTIAVKVLQIRYKISCVRSEIC